MRGIPPIIKIAIGVGLIVGLFFLLCYLFCEDTALPKATLKFERNDTQEYFEGDTVWFTFADTVGSLEDTIAWRINGLPLSPQFDSGKSQFYYPYLNDTSAVKFEVVDENSRQTIDSLSIRFKPDLIMLSIDEGNKKESYQEQEEVRIRATTTSGRNNLTITIINGSRRPIRKDTNELTYMIPKRCKERVVIIRAVSPYQSQSDSFQVYKHPTECLPPPPPPPIDESEFKNIMDKIWDDNIAARKNNYDSAYYTLSNSFPNGVEVVYDGQAPKALKDFLHTHFWVNYRSMISATRVPVSSWSIQFIKSNSNSNEVETIKIDP